MDVSSYTNREVSFSFSGQRFSFALSLGLFSSGGVDVGTRLLLKTLASLVASHDRQIVDVIDVGSGVGVIGICLAKCLSEANVTMVDRDALAIAFSRYNAEKNAVENCTATGALGVRDEGADDRERYGGPNYDLVVSNVPAKAGKPVLRRFCSDSLDALKADGMAAFVVVNPISELIGEAIEDAGGEVVFSEVGSGHTVFHFVRDGERRETAVVVEGMGAEKGKLDAAYIRRTGEVEVSSKRMELSTVYGLPEFDTPSYSTVLGADFIESLRKKTSGPGKKPARPRKSEFARVLVWNPGQGYLPCFLADRLKSREITLAGRDLLSLLVSAENLRDRESVAVQIAHLPSILDVKVPPDDARYSVVVVTYNPVSGVQEAKQLISAASQLLEAGGSLIVTGTSQNLHRVQAAAKGFTLVGSKKHRGFRVVRFVK